jgi:N-terminal region of glycosyl transferase group 7/N-terminal domain of galactosyltransferase
LSELPVGFQSPLQRWLSRFWPSTRVRHDPLSDWLVDDRYAPVSVANWKLTPSMRRHLLARRRPLPLTFEPDQRLTVVIPFRDRDAHLRESMPRLNAILREQLLRYRVVVVEQEPGGLFNRGRLINAGIHYAAADSDYYCLHDVDAVPVVANYLCPSQPLRLVSRILSAEADAPESRTDYYFSGAISIRKEQVFAANGYSNEYWGWGKEDDDFFFRLLLAGHLCYYDTLGTFHDLSNPPDQRVLRKSPQTPPYVRHNRERRSRLVRGLSHATEDGLSTLRYEVVERVATEDHERILVRW